VFVIYQNGMTALHWASIGGHDKIIILLLDTFATINIKDKVCMSINIMFSLVAVDCFPGLIPLIISTDAEGHECSAFGCVPRAALIDTPVASARSGCGGN
jgi:hypothetical protein